MTNHLMNLRHVPDDEADEIRELFEAHDIPYYETPPSRWGISMGGFWVHDNDEARRARKLLEDYQRERLQHQREAYRRDLAEGRTGGFWYRLRQKPVTTVAACLAILIILALTVAPFVTL
ncbi:hypothetical protein FDP08_13105 [Marinobacter panjinensis]|uniref:Transmembrane protein n=1 Tax=Marinobacter panjinensis TaxID=2576384 RepID=A0A4U6R5U9_9GAMM|nr:DUF6164 family protein [Marinobacter panjinensis]MCR8914183.1 DUF6164 family protein [Marinobacter panjinensis]TKV68963.1 hypothetical protein FDP08_13105 [Marinobacter panjinensis]